MKRKIYVPIMFSNINDHNCYDYISRFRSVGTDFVFIAINRAFLFSSDKEYRKNFISDLKRYIGIFEDAGFETGIWFQAFGFGEELSPERLKRSEGMTKIKSITGNTCGDAFCPEDQNFMDMYCQSIKELANSGTKLILIDDDLCLSVRPGIGCFCENHIALLEEKLCRKLNRETLEKDFFTGESNEYRKAFFEVMGNSLRKFCKTLRRMVDEVNPNVRLGFCAGYTSWDLEGATAFELTKILAGNTKPFLRFTGAPYWVAQNRTRFPGQRLHAVIDFARVQEHWCKNKDIEYFSEADSFPRPRFQIPASLVECFDAAMVASNNTPTLKYLFDYYSPLDFEIGYERAHLKNAELYSFLEKHFTDKTNYGIKINEKTRKYNTLTLSENLNENSIMNYSLPCSAPFLTQLGIPVTYEENSRCEIAFGENVGEITSPYVILDLPAAYKLMQSGMDVGIKEITDMGKYWAPFLEIMGDIETRVENPNGKYYEDVKLNDNVEILSYFEKFNKKIPAVIKYDNGETNFLIFMFDAYSVRQSSGVFCSYLRQEQIYSFCPDYPKISKAPFVYQIFKKNNNETALFFANIFEDDIFDFEIKLDRNYSKIECCGSDITLQGDILKVNSIVKPYGMFAVILS